MVHGFHCLRCSQWYDAYQAYCTRLLWEDHKCGGAVSAVYEPKEVIEDRKRQPMFRLAKSSNAQGFEPIVYFEDANGKVVVPGASHARPRAHQVRKEARNIRELEKLEKRVNRQERDKAEQSLHNRQVGRALDETARRRVLRSQMESMDAFGRDLARAAMERTDSRPEVLHEPDVHFDILHNDQGNRDPHVDARTGWRDRRY